MQQALSRRIQQRDAPLEVGGDKSTMHRVNDVLVHRLQAFESAAGVLQLDVDLPQFVAQTAGQICDCARGEQVDEDGGLQRLRVGTADGVGANDFVVRELEHATKGYERQRRRQVCPGARQ